MLRDVLRISGLPGLDPELRWVWVTAFLSGLVVLGYAVVAFNWYFQSKLELSRESRAALRRLCLVVVACALCGYLFVLSDMSWPLWRLYDLVLVALACHTWWFAFRMRGPGLLDERLTHAAELQRSAARYRQIAELLPHFVWTATAEGRVDYSNERWAQYGGCERSWLESVHPDEHAQVAAWWRDGVASRRTVTRQVRLRGRDGGYRMFVVSATPVARGSAVRWLGACADVEDQSRVVAEKEAQAKQKGLFLNALSHDLRAPLNNVVLNAHLLKLSAREQAEVESANVIVENAVAAGEMVTRLLEVAKAEGKRSGHDGAVGQAAVGVAP